MPKVLSVRPDWDAGAENSADTHSIAFRRVVLEVATRTGFTAFTGFATAVGRKSAADSPKRGPSSTVVQLADGKPVKAVKAVGPVTSQQKAPPSCLDGAEREEKLRGQRNPSKGLCHSLTWVSDPDRRCMPPAKLTARRPIDISSQVSGSGIGSAVMVSLPS